MNNGVRAKKNFETKYLGNFVEWKGAVSARTDEERVRPSHPHLHALLYIKMIPSEAKADFPDIIIHVPQELSEEQKEAVDKVEIGTVVKFNGTFMHLGNEHEYHLMHLANFEVPQPVEKVSIADIGMIENTGPSPSSFRTQRPSADNKG